MIASRPTATAVTDKAHLSDRLLPALAAVCAAAGFDHRDARLLRNVGNVTFQLAAHPVVVRLVASPALLHRVPKVIAVARWLAEHDVPAVRLVETVEQPVRVGPHVATFWHHAAATDVRPSGADLARLLHRFHRLPMPAVRLPSWRPLDIVRSRLADADTVADSDREFLFGRCAEVEAELVELRYELPPGPIHGDAYLGNLVASQDGPLLCDFDSACIGPREWDMTPMAVGLFRMRHPRQQYQSFAEEYGWDVTRWPGFAVLRRVRELKMVAGALPVLAGNSQARTEFGRRLASLRTGSLDTTWTPYR